jgi:hypothetical protein
LSFSGESYRLRKQRETNDSPAEPASAAIAPTGSEAPPLHPGKTGRRRPIPLANRNDSKNHSPKLAGFESADGWLYLNREPIDNFYWLMTNIAVEGLLAVREIRYK